MKQKINKCIVILITIDIIRCKIMKTDEEEITINQNNNSLFLTFKNNNRESYILHFSKDRLNTTRFNTTIDIQPFSTKATIHTNFTNSSLFLNISKIEDKVLFFNKYTYTFKSNMSDYDEYFHLGKYINGGYILPSVSGKAKTGFFGLESTYFKILKKSDKDDLVVDNKGRKVYVSSLDWMLHSEYNSNFTSVLPVELGNGADFFNGNDYKLMNSKNIPFGKEINVGEGGVVKGREFFIVSYYGLPLYISKDNHDVSQGNGGQYYTINVNGTINIENRTIIPFSEEFEKYFKEKGAPSPSPNPNPNPITNSLYMLRLVVGLYIFICLII